MSIQRHAAGCDPEPTYCSLCQEKDLDGGDFCEFCEEPTVLYSDYCEAAYERQQADYYGGSGPLPLIEQQRRAYVDKHGRPY